MSKKTFKIAERKKLRLMVSVKDNQKSLLEEVRETFAFFKSEIRSASETNLEPRGIIHKKYDVINLSNPLPNYGKKDWFHMVRAVVRVTRTNCDSKKSESQFYVSNSEVSAKDAKKIIAQHWNIENVLHKTLDVALLEDASRKTLASRAWVHLRSLAFNFLSNGLKKDFTTGIFRNSLNPLNPMKMLDII